MIDDAFSFIRCNIGLHDSSPDHTKPHTLRARATLLHPTKDGLNGPEDFEALNPFEEAIIDALDPSPLAGVVTGAGFRSWHFYSDDPDRDADQVTATASQMIPEYTIECGSFEDPEWQQYFGFLHPNALGWQFISDNRVLRGLADQGDSGEVPRDIAHWAYFDSRRGRRRFVKVVKALAYIIEDMSNDGPDEGKYGVHFKNATPFAPAEIHAATEQLVVAASDCGGEYDGWETMVIKDAPNPKS